MNKEIIKAMNKKKSRWAAVANWWHKNGYKVLRIPLLPLIIGNLAYEKIKATLYNRIEWDETRVNAILNYYIPRASDWNKETQSFYFFDNGRGWSLCIAKRYLKLKDRRFWVKYTEYWGGEIRDYLLNDFQLEGFTKILGDCGGVYTELTFTMNDN